MSGFFRVLHAGTRGDTRGNHAGAPPVTFPGPAGRLRSPIPLRNRKPIAARAMPRLPTEDGVGRFAAPAGRRPDALPSENARELPLGLHLHFHGVDAEDVAEILRRQLP